MSRTISLRGPAAKAFVEAARQNMGLAKKAPTEDEQLEQLATLIHMNVAEGTKRGMSRAVNALRRLKGTAKADG